MSMIRGMEITEDDGPLVSPQPSNYEMKIVEDEDESNRSEMYLMSENTFSVMPTNIGVNSVLPGWEHLFGFLNEEEALDNLKADLSDNPSILKETGTFGENILHWALLMHSNLAAKWLIETHGDLRDKTYGTEDDVEKQTNQRYKGEGCLHIIIANRDFDMALFLLDSYHREETKTFEMGDFESGIAEDYGYPLNKQRAIGDFFKETGDNSVYFGETALDFAVSTNQIEMVDLLMGYPKHRVNGEGTFNGK